MKVLAGLLIVGLVACSADIVDTADHSPNAVRDSVETSGPLRLELRDEPAVGGVLFVSPSVSSASGAVVVRHTRYGSLCQLAVSGTAAIQPTKLDLHVSFEQRTAICSQEIRALSYTATIAAAPGTYNVTVIYDGGTRPDTAARKQVTVP